ncbi:MAG TPA: anti-sigma factor [Allosphingosinicella sp.]|jgi:anti-sigma-K factor RskA
MSTRPPLTAEERDLLAAELAMGLLDGDERAEAERLAGRDHDFRADVARWTAHLAPMLDEVDAVDPPASAWPAIESRIAPTASNDAQSNPAPSNIVQLRRKMNLWRGYSVAATAIAASLALVLVARPGPPAATTVTPTLVAMMQSDAGPARLVATYDPASRRLIVAAAAGMAPAAGHAHELWLIPAAGGRPHPMGIVSAVAPNKMDVPMPMAGDVREGAVFAISVEPPSGSPTGAPTGPVIASGKLTRA